MNNIQIFKKDNTREIRPDDRNDKTIKDKNGVVIAPGMTITIWNGFGLYYKDWKVLDRKAESESPNDYLIISDDDDIDVLGSYAFNLDEEGNSIDLLIS